MSLTCFSGTKLKWVNGVAMYGRWDEAGNGGLGEGEGLRGGGCGICGKADETETWSCSKGCTIHVGNLFLLRVR